MLAAFARRQRGLITYSQLRAAGFSSPAVSRAVRSGRLHRLHRGVYAVGHRGLAPLARELAALLAVGPGAVLGRHSAVALWDMAPALPGAVDVCVRGPGRPNREGLRIHSTSRLDADDVATKHGVLVTRPARTLIDVANAESPRRFSWIAEQARSRRLVSDASLEEAVGRAPSGRGSAVVRAHLLAVADPVFTRSNGERRLLELLRVARLPQPRVNAHVEGWEVDFWWPEEHFAIEFDGWDNHRSRAAFERDSAKQSQLAAVGIQLARVTGRRLRDEPYAVIAEAAAALNAG